MDQRLMHIWQHLLELKIYMIKLVFNSVSFKILKCVVSLLSSYLYIIYNLQNLEHFFSLFVIFHSA